MYSSPEQVKLAQFGEVGWWTDIDQCGAVLYELITEQLPFKGDSPPELALSIAGDEYVKPTELKPGLPLALDDIIASCLCKDRGRRYHDVSMMGRRCRNSKPVCDELPPSQE